MSDVYHRKVSALERLFLVLQYTDPPFANQMVLEGVGTLDESRWKKAVDQACEVNPGSRLVYRGFSYFAKWVDSGVAAPVRLVDGTNWSGMGPEGAPFLDDPMSYKKSHTSEVVLVQGDPPRVIFRTLHTVMDGRGTQTWAEDVFRSLRNEPLIGSSSTMNDVELVASLNKPVKISRRQKGCLAPTGAVDGNELGYVWKRARVQGKFSRLLPQIAILIAKETRKHGEGPVVFNIPVDLRPLTSEIRSTANWTRRIRLAPTLEATVESVQQELIQKRDDIPGDPRIVKLLCYLPLNWQARLIRQIKKRNRRKGIYNRTGTISNMGKLPTELYHGGGFETRSGFFVPPETDGKGIFVGLSGSTGAIDVVIALPKVLATNNRIDKLLSNIVSGLVPKPDEGA